MNGSKGWIPLPFFVLSVPDDITFAALSGIRTREDVDQFLSAGARAVLVGEALMRAQDPIQAIQELKGHTTNRSVRCELACSISLVS